MASQENTSNDLKHKSVHAGAWVVVGNALSSASGFVVFLFLTNVITPEELGVVAIVDLILGLGSRVLSTGITEPLVQFRHLERKHIDALFWVIQLIGWILCIGLILVSGRLSAFLGVGDYFGLLATSALVFNFQAMVLVPQALLARDMHFSSIARASIFSEWTASVCALVAAFAGVGVWAFILQRLLQSFFFFAFVVYVSKFNPQLQWSYSHFKEVAGFSSSRLFDNLVLYCDQNAPRFLLGFVAGPVELGYFSFARSVTDALLKSITLPIRTISMSALSKVQTDLPHVRSIYLQGLSFTCGILFPLSIGLCCIASDVVEFFGSKWMAGVLLVQVLSLAMLRNAFHVWNASSLRALGFPRALLMLTILRAVCTFCNSALLLPFGALGVCIAVLISGFLISPFAMRVTRSVLGLQWNEQIKPAYYPLLSSLVMGVCLILARGWILLWIPLPYRIALSVVFGGAVYIGVLFIVDRRTLQRWIHYFSLLLRRNKR